VIRRNYIITCVSNSHRANQSLQLFMSKHVAQVVEIPLSRVKDWTIGRPLRIVPSIAAQGTGTRNLYALQDVLRFAIAKQLTASGLTPGIIQEVLDQLGDSILDSWGFLLTWPAQRVNVSVIAHPADERELMRQVLKSPYRTQFHLLAFGPLVKAIKARAEDVLAGKELTKTKVIKLKGREAENVVKRWLRAKPTSRRTSDG
jgi:hypothetical protein